MIATGVRAACDGRCTGCPIRLECLALGLRCPDVHGAAGVLAEERLGEHPAEPAGHAEFDDYRFTAASRWPSADR